VPPLPAARTFHWTLHALGKLQHYKLSQSRVRRIVHSPHRIEEGIAPGTIAMMQRSTGKSPYELWVMLVDTPSERKVISAWRYPGTTEPRAPLPQAVRSALEQALDEALSVS
jgi:hypothetical protein